MTIANKLRHVTIHTWFTPFQYELFKTRAYSNVDPSYEENLVAIRRWPVASDNEYL